MKSYFSVKKSPNRLVSTRVDFYKKRAEYMVLPARDKLKTRQSVVKDQHQQKRKTPRDLFINPYSEKKIQRKLSQVYKRKNTVVSLFKVLT